MMLRSTLLAFTAALLVAQTPAPEPKKADAPKPEAAKVEAVKPAAQPEAKPAAPAQELKAAPVEVKTDAPKAEPVKPEPPKPEPPKPKEDKVLARLGNRIIKESDFDTFTDLAMQPQQRMQMEMIPAIKDQFRKNFLDFMVREAKARKEGLDKTDAAKKKFRMMEAQILNMELINRDGEMLQKKVVVDDAAVKAYYDKHIEDFKTKGSFNARHILISVKEGDKEKTEAAAQAKIAKIKEALKSGKKLADLAKEYSDDPGSKDKNGLYENVTYGSFVPSFEEAVLKQKIGEVGEPVKSNYGYHIIQVEKRVEAETKPFDKVKDQCKQKAQNDKQEEVFNAYMEAMRKEVGFVEGTAAMAPEPATKPVAGASKKTKKGKKK